MRSVGIKLGESELVQAAALCAREGEEAQTEELLQSLQHLTDRLLPSSLRTLQAVLGHSLEERWSRINTSRMTTVNAEGRCDHCGAQMTAMSLTEEQVAGMESAILGAAASLGLAFRDDITRFREWVRTRHFRYVIDGANVAYQKQNRESGHFSFQQLELVRQELLRRGEEPLLILPERYLPDDTAPGQSVPNHILVGSRSNATFRPAQPVSAEDAACVSAWRASGTLWSCPEGAEDDWYWMLALIARGSDARVVTTDMMRDHAKLMTNPGLMVRWRNRHIAQFDFTHAAAPWLPLPAVSIFHPPPFACEIQEAATGWHFPAADAEMWLCAGNVGGWGAGLIRRSH